MFCRCEFCKKLAPEYEKAANMLRDRNSSIKLGRVDCTVEKDLAKKYEINIYPTLKVTNRGKISDYEGATEAESIVNYMLSISNDTHEQRESSEKEAAGESLKENIGLIEEEKA
ncbi:Protein disulfide-isomerase domain protein [Trichostrongylus colubriformis]|uniref:protein disulfide-isomerase n=1 Tax=Trichostrongylus colubriformis TaxID=6319 RepID=A0AAN8IS23_TRICO